MPYRTLDEQAASRHQLRRVDDELRVELYLKRMQEERERQL
jgi:hypothetical protein